jgi:hypothetical protein
VTPTKSLLAGHAKPLWRRERLRARILEKGETLYLYGFSVFVGLCRESNSCMKGSSSGPRCIP